jgi:hypothetical protein
MIYYLQDSCFRAILPVGYHDEKERGLRGDTEVALSVKETTAKIQASDVVKVIK